MATRSPFQTNLFHRERSGVAAFLMALLTVLAVPFVALGTVTWLELTGPRHRRRSGRRLRTATLRPRLHQAPG